MRDFPTIYDLVLYTILVAPGVMRKALLLLAGTKSVYAAVQKGVSQGHIRESRIKLSSYARAKTITSYVITPAGMAYLQARASQYPEEARWVAALPETENVYFRPGAASNSTMLRVARSASSVVIAALCNAHVAPALLPSTAYKSQERARDGNYSELICSALGSHMPRNINPGVSSEVWYFTADQAKALLSEQKPREAGADRTRYVGVFATPKSLFFVFYLLNGGLPINKLFTLQEHSDYCACFKHPAFHQKGDPVDYQCAPAMRGIVIIDSPRVFAQMYQSALETNYQSREAKMVECMDVFDFSPGGIATLKLLLTGVLESRIDAMINSAAKLANFTKNNNLNEARYYPLVHEDGAPVLNGMVLSALRLTKHKGVRPVPKHILCFKWQVQYYKKIFPYAEFLFANDPK